MVSIDPRVYLLSLSHKASGKLKFNRRTPKKNENKYSPFDDCLAKQAKLYHTLYPAIPTFCHKLNHQRLITTQTQIFSQKIKRFLFKKKTWTETPWCISVASFVVLCRVRFSSAESCGISHRRWDQHHPEASEKKNQRSLARGEQSGVIILLMEEIQLTMQLRDWYFIPTQKNITRCYTSHPRCWDFEKPSIGNYRDPSNSCTFS